MLTRLAAAIVLAAAATPFSALAGSFTVTTDADAGAGSLREAVGLANGSAGADTISFALGTGQTTIALASALPDITGDLVLDGPAADLTIRGTANGDSLLRVASGETVLQDLTLDQGTVSIASGAKLSFDLAEDRGLARDISDAGSLEKRGTAKLTLTGTNSYTGGTNVAAGTLQGNVASLPGNLAVASGATLVFDQSASDTKAGVISGTGSLIKTGAGTLILTGSNTFTGQTSVSQGVLQGTAETLPGTFSVASGAKLSFNQIADGSEGGSISGAGSLEKLGAGTLTLSGSNSYTGGTSVDAGLLRGSAESIPGNVSLAAGTGIVFDQASSATKAGDISGAGTLTKLGAGTLTLSGSNSYSGGTTVSAGALRGTTSSLQGDIDNSASLIFDQETSGSYAGVISGSGTLQKLGSGTVQISQSQSYTGLTTVAGGTLELLAANLGGDVDVLSGGTIAGSGALAGLDAGAGSTVAPRTASSGFGTLTVGTATFAGGSTLRVRVEEGGGRDRLVSSGAVTIDPGAGLDLRPGPGSYAIPVDFDVLTGTSVSGNFTLPQFAFLDVTSANLGNLLRVTVQASGGSVSALAQTANQQAVAETLEAIQPSASGDLASVFDSLILLTPEEVPAVLDSLSGEIVADFEHTRLAVERRFDHEIAARLANRGSEGRGETAPRESAAPVPEDARRLPAVGGSHRGDTGMGAWISGLGLLGDIEGDDAAADFDYRTAGATIGLDYRARSGLAVGAVLGYAYSDLELSGVPGDGDADSFLAALYAGYGGRRFQVSGSTRLGLHDMETSRRIRFGAIDREARGDLDGQDYGAALAASAHLASVGPFQIEPTGSLSYTKLERSSFTEDGAGSLSLRIEDESLDSLQSSVGLRAHALFEGSDGTVLAPEFFASWLYEFGDVERELQARFLGASVDAPFRIVGAELPRSSAFTGVRWVTSNGRGASAEFSYAAIWSAQQIEHSLSLVFHLAW